MSHAFFWIRRFRIMRRGKAVYDQPFHLGVNISRGENGSGKSTIADFIFYSLGGEIDDWKTAAKLCDEVQVEIQTTDGVLTLKRPVEGKQTPISIFFGPMAIAASSNLDGWQRFPIRRQQNAESFSQIAFRSMGIPEAQSDGSSNITMHQMMRLLYSDQRTPAPRLFRFELFDTVAIREAVGDLICGSNPYEGYSLQLEIRQQERELKSLNTDLDASIRALPPGRETISVPAVETELSNLASEAAALGREIEAVDSLIPSESMQTFSQSRRTLGKTLDKVKQRLKRIEESNTKVDLELSELETFIAYLEQQSRKLKNTQQAAGLIGEIEFQHCPACLAPLHPTASVGTCVLCGSNVHPEEQQSRYLQIRIDIDTQLREGSQLREAKLLSKQKLHEEYRIMYVKYENLLSDYTTQYDQSNSPRDAFLAQRFVKIGRLEQAIASINDLRELASRIEKKRAARDDLEEKVKRSKEILSEISRARARRIEASKFLISSIAVRLLGADLPRQDEFQNAGVVNLAFGDDAILVDNAANFAESSNVVLKNCALLSLLSAACQDANFFHPRFLLLDNVEDKGMEQIRSHNFQSLIVEESDKATMDHQIIFTTSMMNPKLEQDAYIVGPAYTKVNRTLAITLESADSPN